MKFKHKPKLGDIIYSLPVIKYMGGGVLYLDPVSEHFPGEKDEWIKKFNWFMPLLKAQDYIKDVKIYEGEKYDIDLDKYMNTTHLNYMDKVNIVDNHFIAQGITPPKYEPWLKSEKIKGFDIVVSNSLTHHNKVDYNKLLKDKEFIFLGLSEEALMFEKRVNYEFPVSHFNVNDILQIAYFIDACSTFIGNQSLPLAIALGLGKKCLVEESIAWPNCIMGNYTKL